MSSRGSKKFPLLQEFIYFIKERWSIHVKRSTGAPPPWTADSILQKYRFTNVRRSDDRVTRHIHGTWLLPHQEDLPTVIFAMCLARTVNLPSMLEELGYPYKWDPARFVKLMEARKAAGERSWTAAYVINAVGAAKGQSKASYLAASVLSPVWAVRRQLSAVALAEASLRAFHARLMQCHGFGGGFMAAQVVADLKYIPPLNAATDWHTFAYSGPGSRRGLNRLCGRDVKARWNEEEWHATLMELRATVLPKLPAELRELDAQGLQNCGCEFDKYQRAVLSQGRPKQYFKASEEAYT